MVSLTTVEGCITKVRNIITYNLRGVMEICRLPQAKFGLGRTVCSKLSGVQSWVSHFTTPFPAGIVSPEGVHSVDALVLYGNTIYSVRGILFNCINPDRITPGRRLPEATQSTLRHYFITSYTDTSTYLLIIDKFPLIRYQATVKQSTLILADSS